MPSSPQRGNAARESRGRAANFLGQHGSRPSPGANQAVNVYEPLARSLRIDQMALQVLLFPNYCLTAGYERVKDTKPTIAMDPEEWNEQI
jgi:hypothetical protein